MESGHYAAAHIRAVAARLDRVWKEFASGLDERTAVLALSVLFHHKAEQVSFVLHHRSILYSKILIVLTLIFKVVSYVFLRLVDIR